MFLYSAKYVAFLRLYLYLPLQRDFYPKIGVGISQLLLIGIAVLLLLLLLLIKKKIVVLLLLPSSISSFQRNDRALIMSSYNKLLVTVLVLVALTSYVNANAQEGPCSSHEPTPPPPKIKILLLKIYVVAVFVVMICMMPVIRLWQCMRRRARARHDTPSGLDI